MTDSSTRAPHERVELVDVDITTVAVDAIVNAANSALAGGGGVDGAIHRAAGPELMAACREIGGCPTGEAVVTPGFRLPARFVIHAVGPIWAGELEVSEPLLAGAYAASFRRASEVGARSVACAAISCGVYRFPHPQAARIAVRAALEALGTRLVERVTFCLPDPSVMRAFDTALDAARSR